MKLTPILMKRKHYTQKVWNTVVPQIMKTFFLLGLFLATSSVLGQTSDETKKNKAPTNTEISKGREVLDSIEIDLRNGLFSNKYLPFDVPFILQGDLPKDVIKIAIVYGPKKAFTLQSEQLHKELSDKHELHLLKMNSVSKKDIKNLQKVIKHILSTYYSSNVLNTTKLNDTTKINQNLLNELIIESGVDLKCWRCVDIQPNISKFECDTSSIKYTTASDSCDKIPCDINDVVVALEKSYISLGDDKSNYKKLRKKKKWIDHEIMNIEEIDFLLDNASMRPKKIEAGKIGIALWEKPVKYDSFGSSNTSCKSGSKEKFSVQIDPLRANKHYKFFVKLYYDANAIEQKTISYTAELVEDQFIDQNKEVYFNLSKFLKDTNNNLKTKKRDSILNFKLKDTCYSGKYLLKNNPLNYTDPDSELITTLSPFVLKTIRDSIKYFYSSNGIHNTKALDNTYLFLDRAHSKINISNVEQSLKEDYELAFKEKVTVRWDLLVNEQYVTKYKDSLCKTSYYHKLINHFSNDVRYDSSQKIIRKTFLDEESFEDIVDGRRIIDSSFTEKGGLWFPNSEELREENIRILRKNITKLEKLRSYVIELKSSAIKIGIEPYLDSSKKHKYLELSIDINSYYDDINNFQRRIFYLDSITEVDIQTSIQQLEKQLKEEEDKDKIKSLNSSRERYERSKIENKNRISFLNTRIDSLNLLIDQSKIDRQNLGIDSAINQLEKEASEFVTILDNLLKELYLRQSKMEDKAYQLETAENQYKNISKQILNGADFSSTYSIAGASTDEYTIRGQYYISADLGISWINLRHEKGTVQPYVGVNFNLFPINKQALPGTYNLFSRNCLRGISIMLGATINRNNDKLVYHQNILANNVTLLSGIGFRLNDFCRISFGGVWTHAKLSGNPILDDYKLTVNPFISLSLDWDVRKYLGAFGQLIFADRETRANIVEEAFKQD